MPTNAEARAVITKFMDNVRNFFPALLECDKWLAAMDEAEVKETSLGRRIADLTTAISSAESRLTVANKNASDAEAAMRLAEAAGLVARTNISELESRATEFRTRADLLSEISRLTTARDSLVQDIADLKAKHL